MVGNSLMQMAVVFLYRIYYKVWDHRSALALIRIGINEVLIALKSLQELN